jgi:hypothetical protein
MTDIGIVPRERDCSPAGRRSVATPVAKVAGDAGVLQEEATTQLAGALPQLVTRSSRTASCRIRRK